MNFSHLQTQKSIKKYTRNIIDTIGLCSDIKNKYPDEYYYFTSFLFPRHPKYPEKFINMVNISIQKNKMFKKQLEVHIIKKDGSSDDVSVMKNCVSGKQKNNLSRAMRYSIYPQISNYKNSLTELKCTKCKSIKNIQIDHYNLQFIDLQKIFLEKTSLEIPNIFADNEWNVSIFREIDNMFEKEWYLFHYKNANLQPLCAKCNSSKKKSKNKFKHINKNTKK